MTTGDLNFQRCGSGEPLVLLHGIGSDLCVWEPVLERLCTERRDRSSLLTGAERIDVPVTVAWGERDRLVRPAPLPAPLARSMVLADCGHVPMWDAPDLVADVLQAGSSRSV